MKTQLPATFNARLAVCAIFATAFSTSISAEPAEITIAKEYGIGYLPYMIMENNKLVEKHAAALGLKDMKINWQTFGGSGLMQSAMIAGRLDFASSGVPWFLTMWDKLNGQVKSPGALDSMPIYLNTRNPNVKTIRDFTEKDKIALPAVKSSIQAITLQMAATAMFGSENVTKLDTLTVSLSHPDAMNALLSGISEIDSHFASSPFQELELKDPASMPDGELMEDFEEIERASERLKARRLALLAHIDRRRTWALDGHLSAASWIVTASPLTKIMGTP